MQLALLHANYFHPQQSLLALPQDPLLVHHICFAKLLWGALPLAHISHREHFLPQQETRISQSLESAPRQEDKP